MIDRRLRRVRLIVRGRVQGVNFRYYGQVAARERGLTGWIRNREDGEVEAVAEGDPTAIESFVAWCRRGPPAARVAAVEETELDGDTRYVDFRIVSAPEE